jgi:hypothetical protein
LLYVLDGVDGSTESMVGMSLIVGFPWKRPKTRPYARIGQLYDPWASNSLCLDAYFAMGLMKIKLAE